MRVLLVTVGGSPEPILHAVRSHAPDLVVFVCSAPPCPAPSQEQVIGDGTPCLHTLEDGGREARPNLLQQLQLENFQPGLQLVALPDPDHLADCYRRLRRRCLELRERFPRLQLLGDYSGGTKTMSAALVMALLEQDAELSVVAGARTNLQRIDQSEGIRPIAASPLLATRLLQERLPVFLADHRYDRAAAAVREFLTQQGEELEPEQADAARALLGALDALVLWDRFQWLEALNLARSSPLSGELPELIDWWQRVVHARRWLDGHPQPEGITGYELVQDLLLNAERRGRRGWYDDALARLYRALELLFQTYIQLEHGLDHRDFWTDPSVNTLRADLRFGKGVAGLYRWLRHREGDTGLGGAAGRQWPHIRRLITSRNDSLLAHGLQPVAQSTWCSLQDRISNLVRATLVDLRISQGPPPEQLPALQLLHLPSIQPLID